MRRQKLSVFLGCRWISTHHHFLSPNRAIGTKEKANEITFTGDPDTPIARERTPRDISQNVGVTGAKKRVFKARQMMVRAPEYAEANLPSSAPDVWGMT